MNFYKEIGFKILAAELLGEKEPNYEKMVMDVCKPVTTPTSPKKVKAFQPGPNKAEVVVPKPVVVAATMKRNTGELDVMFIGDDKPQPLDSAVWKTKLNDDIPTVVGVIGGFSGIRDSNGNLTDTYINQNSLRRQWVPDFIPSNEADFQYAEPLVEEKSTKKPWVPKFDENNVWLCDEVDPEVEQMVYTGLPGLNRNNNNPALRS